MRLARAMLNGAPLAPGADPRTGARPLRDAWLWRVLPADARRVGAHGGSLAHTLRAAGYDAVDPGERDLDAVVLDAGDALPPARTWARADVALVAVALGGGRDTVPERVARPLRAAQLGRDALLAGLVRHRARGVARDARAAGRAVTILTTSDRARPHRLGGRGTLRPQAGSIVSATTGPPQATAYGAALVAALTAGGAEERGRGVQVVESGKLIARTVGADGAPMAVVRVGAGPAGTLIATACEAVSTLGAASAPEDVRRLVPRSIAAGRAGLASFSVEAWVAGERPAALDEPLWRSCCDFLEGLRSIPVDPGPDAAALLAADRELLADLLPAAARERLGRVGRLLDAELSGVALGWAHGDFWPDNLIVRDGRLAAVLDWDTAGAHELPGLDALDLLGFGAPHGRWLTFGPRLVRSILPLARAGDPRLAAHCRAVGAPASPAGLEALAWAWWLRRTALTVRDYPDRRARPLWLRENLEKPLAQAPAG